MTNKKYDRYDVDEYYEIVLHFHDLHKTIFHEGDYDYNDYSYATEEELELDNIQKVIIEVTEVLISHEENISNLHDIKSIRNQVRELIKYRDKLIKEQLSIDELEEDYLNELEEEEE